MPVGVTVRLYTYKQKERKGELTTKVKVSLNLAYSGVILSVRTTRSVLVCNSSLMGSIRCLLPANLVDYRN